MFADALFYLMAGKRSDLRGFAGDLIRKASCVSSEPLKKGPFRQSCAILRIKRLNRQDLQD